jgi:hypothetical protein
MGDLGVGIWWSQRCRLHSLILQWPALVFAVYSKISVSWLNESTRNNRGTVGNGVSYQVKVNITLRPTVSRPVCLGVKPHLGPKARFLLLWDICGFVDVGRPLWRGDGSVIYRGHIQQYMSSVFTILHVGILHSFCLVKSPVPCEYILFTVLRVCMYVCMYNTYKGSVSLGLAQKVMP